MNINVHGQAILKPEMVGWHTQETISTEEGMNEEKLHENNFSIFHPVDHWDINIFGIFSCYLNCKI